MLTPEQIAEGIMLGVLEIYEGLEIETPFGPGVIPLGLIYTKDPMNRHYRRYFLNGEPPFNMSLN